MEGDPEYARRKRYDVPPEQAASILRGAERAAAEEPAPLTPVDAVEEAVEAIVGDGAGDEDAAKRERRRQRRRSRPHGRAR
jgi:hypothetical protein